MQVKKRYPKGVFVYIVPPSLEILSQRIHARGTDSEEVIQNRLAQITNELSMMHQYDYVVVNDVLEDAVHKTCAIIEAENASCPGMKDRSKPFLSSISIRRYR